MKKVAIIGRWLNDSNVAGIHRFTLEILKELDKIVNTNEVELLIPISESAQYDFSHINVIQLGKKIPGKIGQRIEGYLYKTDGSFFTNAKISEYKAAQKAATMVKTKR